MALLNVTMAVNTASKTCVQQGTPSIRETVKLVFSGIPMVDPDDLVVAITANGDLMAECEALTQDGASYVAEIDLGTDALINHFASPRNKRQRSFRIVLQDVPSRTVYLDDMVEIMDNPYYAGMTAPATVAPIGA
jgi:hypothetical protein